MSSIKLESNASGTGIFTIASPNSNTNRTLTLPDNTGTVLTSATTTGFPAGSVIQVVSATYSTGASTSGTTLVDTGLSASITPTSASNKVLIFVSINGILKAVSATGVSLSLLRGSTSISAFCVYTNYSDGGQTGLITSASTNYLDSPATTSSTTYTFYFKNSVAGNATFPVNGGTSTIVLMEIAA